MTVRPATWFPILTVFVVIAAAAAPPVEVPVKSAIENCDPLWSPPKDVLRGWTIAIDPGDAARDARDHRETDLGLLTAAHLYHFVKQAGGTAVLTRADESRVAADSGPASRADAVRRADCDVCVLIRYAAGADGGRARVPLAAPGENDVHLAEALQAALGSPAKQLAPEPTDEPFLALVRPAGQSARPVLSRVDFPAAEPGSAICLNDRRACFSNARQLFDGLQRYCSARVRPAADSDGAAPRTGPPLAGLNGNTARLAHAIWPRETLPPESADWFCRRYADAVITDRSLVYFDVGAQVTRATVVLEGATNVPALVAGLEAALRAVGVDRTRNTVRALPARESLGDELFGVCRASLALTFDRPVPGAGLQTQVLFGEPVFLLDATDEHYLLHAGDGYWGWVPREAITPLTAAEFDRYIQQPRAAVMVDIEEGSVRIPRGATVRVVSADADACAILLPGGGTLSVAAATVRVDDSEAAQAAQRVRAALDLLYTPYVFGGRSPLGLDCSGLVTSVLAREGTLPARDAWQQALAGGLVATPWHRANIRAGDLLYFINSRGKVYHTGVALDATHFVHSAPPCVQISSFDPRDPLYDESHVREFFIAKRP